MGVREVAKLLDHELRRRGIGPVLAVRGGTWTEPASIEMQVKERRVTTQLWEGSHADDKMLNSVLLDALCTLWDVPLQEAQARLGLERSQAQR